MTSTKFFSKKEFPSKHYKVQISNAIYTDMHKNINLKINSFEHKLLFVHRKIIEKRNYIECLMTTNVCPCFDDHKN